jgi:uncharacterized protein (DUF885 family)
MPLFAALLAVSPAPSSAPMNESASALDATAGRYWQRELESDYVLRSQIGLPIETIRSVTYANADEDARFGESILDSLKGIDAAQLDHDRWLTYRTLSYLASNDVANRRYFWLRQEATPYAGGLQIGYLASIFASFQFNDAGDAKRYESLLEQYAAFVSSLRDFLQSQHERRIILPVAEIDATQAVYEGYARPAQSNALVPDEARLEALVPGDRAAFRSACASLVSSKVVPAFASVAAYLKGAYRQGAPSRVGLSQYPGGSEYYRYLVVANTTLVVSPERLHSMGLEEVAKLNAQLDGIRRELRYRGSLAAFKHFLAHDPKFFIKTPEEFGRRLEIYVQRAQAAAPNYFASLPKAPYGVESLPKELAGSQTFGYYDQPTAARPKGIYFYNAWHPERTSALGAGALICHELIPGHHFQIALQQENTALPDVRHYDFSETGFVEGWGEYASQLCWDMGVYRTPYDRAGRLMQDLMVSTRLVVDTGMNALGWSRDRAVEFMRDNLTISESQIESESLRYSTDIPGQALAYKTGELTMLAIRENARKRLGPVFNIRTYHSWVLDSGAMTLDTLREHVDYEIARQLQRAGSRKGRT